MKIKMVFLLGCLTFLTGCCAFSSYCCDNSSIEESINSCGCSSCSTSSCPNDSPFDYDCDLNGTCDLDP